jgi:NAD(P)-dependent dehydrogenase (short-subunit alcohol dehydrogenase family)
VDVTNSESVAAFVETIAGHLQQPVLVYTPGVSLNATAHKITDADWDQTIAINLTGAMRAARAVLPIMRTRQWGRIVFLSSVLARQGVPGTIAYSATKAALAAMARVISMENATKGITANAVTLGYFNIGIIQAVPEQYLREHVIPGIPQGRLGDPATIAAAIRFIIEADYLTGATLDVNGGMFAP